MTCEEGRDGTTVTYRERLSPPWWVWTLGALFAGGVGVAYGFALGPVAGMAAATALALGTGLLLVASTVTISVDECVLRVGRARLPVRFAGEVTTLDPEASARARTRDFDPAAFVLLRTWATARSVRVSVADARDPHPFWLVSARDPEALAQAVRAARAGTLGSTQKRSVGRPGAPSGAADPQEHLHSSRETP